jgi:alkylated DNA repair dioxygenase AlkB
MDLFANIEDGPANILPMDGCVHYFGQVLSIDQSNTFLKTLVDEIEWRHDEAVIFGRKIITKRKVAWYADRPFSYSYSNTTKTALPWILALRDLKAIVEDTCSETFNSCLLNLYHDGDEGMAWHSDAERELEKFGAIASVSLGAERKFSFKHKATKRTISQSLEHGSLLVMKGQTQHHWLHSLPKTKKVKDMRLNLTFRTIASG